jgi:hypothetical protein
MTNEERDLITGFIQRVGGARPAGGFPAAPGQPATPPLPPVDPEADALIGQLFATSPEARYRITQMAFVQEHALAEAQNRLQRLEWELQQARQQAAPPAPTASPWGQAQQQPAQPASRGLFGSLFGGGARQAQPQQQYAPPQYAPPPPPPPQYAPGYSPGMFQQRGSGFLGSALTTAAGVAGGMVAGNALMNLFSGGHGGFASVPAGGFMPTAAAASPWATPAAGGAADPYDTGGAEKTEPDSSGWTNADPAAPDDQQVAGNSDWTDPGSDAPDAGGDPFDTGGGSDWTT